MTSKQRYYNKEYARLIDQAKRMYSDLKLGGTLGMTMPSFEKLLNYEGTRSGLKKPTKASLKALRKLQTEEDILRTIRNVLPKKSPYREIIQDMIYEKEEMNTIFKKAKRTIRMAAKKEGGKQSYKEGSKESFITKPIETLLFQLRAVKSYCRDRIKTVKKIKQDWAYESANDLQAAIDTADEFIDYCKKILDSGNVKDINKLAENCERFFHENSGGVDIKDMYNGGSVLRQYLFNAISDMMDEQNDTNSNSIPIDDVEYDLDRYGDELLDPASWV